MKFYYADFIDDYTRQKTNDKYRRECFMVDDNITIDEFKEKVTKCFEIQEKDGNVVFNLKDINKKLEGSGIKVIDFTGDLQFETGKDTQKDCI